MKLRELLARVQDHDDNAEGNIRWASRVPDDYIRPLWELGTVTLWTQWAIGAEVHYEHGGEGTYGWPSRLTLLLTFGPWAVWIERQWRRHG